MLCGCNNPHYVSTDSSNGSDSEASVDVLSEETRNSCPEQTVVWPEWETRAVIVSTTNDVVGNTQQDLVFSFLSPVLLETTGTTGYNVELVIDSVVQRPMVVNGNVLGLNQLTVKDQNRCGYVYEAHIMFITTGCEQRTCNFIRPGENIRVQINTCAPSSGVCTQGKTNNLVISG